MTTANALTEAQAADIATTRAKWQATDISTTPIDREAAKSAVAKMYIHAGYAPPEAFIFVDSPLQGIIAAAFVRHPHFGMKKAPLGFEQVKAQVWEKLNQRPHQLLSTGIIGSWNGISDQVVTQLARGLAGESTVAPLVRKSIIKQLDTKSDDTAEQLLMAAFSGSHAGFAMGFDDFAYRHFGLCLKSQGHVAAAESCGWVWLFRGVAIITDRPSVVRTDSDGKLHSADGPAVEYRDGFAVFAKHGKMA